MYVYRDVCVLNRKKQTSQTRVNMTAIQYEKMALKIARHREKKLKLKAHH